ncbi:MAG: hypothetical protein CMD33_10440 [Flavobacteriales bacterium]|nr:hypothetical protein [Flavobacteriales bacterium]
MSARHYISGYWPLVGNEKKPGSHYLTLLPETLAPLRGASLIFYSNDPAMLDRVMVLSEHIGFRCEPRLRQIEDLPAWSLAGEMVQACERMNLEAWPMPRNFACEKGSKHYWRDFKGSGSHVYRQLLSIWLSKISLVTDEARQQLDPRSVADPSNSLAWIDASLARFNRRRRRWRYWRVKDCPGRLSHYRSSMRCFGVLLPAQAGFLTAEVSLWPELEALFLEASAAAVSMAYAHDEETVLAECRRRQPKLFRSIDAPRRLLLKRLWNC